MQTGSAQFTQGRAVRPQPIRDDRIRPGVALHQFPEEFQGGLAVSLLRDKGLQHLAFLVHGTPQVMAFAIDFHEHLIEVPPPSRQRAHSTRSLLAHARRQRAEVDPQALAGLVLLVQHRAQDEVRLPLARAERHARREPLVVDLVAWIIPKDV